MLVHNNDYDLVSVVKVDSLNRAVEKYWGTSPREVVFEDSGIKLVAKCAPWSLIPDQRSGIYVPVKFSFTDGVFIENNTYPIPLKGVVCMVDLTLEFVYTGVGDRQELQFCPQRVLDKEQQRCDDLSQMGCLVARDVEFPAGVTVSRSTKRLFAGVVCEMLIHNFELIRFAFALLENGSSFLPVRASRYCYLQEGYLAVMSVCDDRDVRKMALSVTLPAGAKCSLLSVSGDVFFKSLAPAFEQVFCEPIFYQEMRYRVSGLEFQGQRVITPVKAGAILYYPKCRRMELWGADAKRLSLKLEGDCDLYYGIRMRFTYSFGFRMFNDSQSVNFDVYPTTSRDWYDVKVPPYLSWMLGIPHVVANIIASLLDKRVERELGRRFFFGARQFVTWAHGVQKIANAYFDTNFTIEYQDR